MKKKLWIWIILGVAVVAIAVVLLFGKKGSYEVILTTQMVEEDSIVQTVTATGEIQPVYKVEVGTQVSGIVQKLYVDFNSQVKKGQLLAELDKSTLNEQVKQSRANLSTAQSNKALYQKTFDRIASLYASKAATQEEYDQAESQLQQAKNQLVTAQSNYENAVTNLKYAEIYSPIDGVVLNKEVEEGQTVASSFSTPTLFTIANDLTRMQVEAAVDEADIGEIKEGQRVTFTVDAFPKDVFNGTVHQIRLEPTVTSNVVTYTVIIDAPNPDAKLYPGMTANVSIITQEEKGLMIPLEAEYFEPEMVKEDLQAEGYTVETVKKGPHSVVVYVVEGNRVVPKPITVSMDDGVNVIVTDGLSEGEVVLLSVTKEQKSAKSKEASKNPLQMGPPQRKTRE